MDKNLFEKFYIRRTCLPVKVNGTVNQKKFKNNFSLDNYQLKIAFEEKIEADLIGFIYR